MIMDIMPQKTCAVQLVQNIPLKRFKLNQAKREKK